MGEFLTKFGRSDSGDGKFVDPTNMLISDQLDLRRESIYPRQEVSLDLHIFLCSWANRQVDLVEQLTSLDWQYVNPICDHSGKSTEEQNFWNRVEGHWSKGQEGTGWATKKGIWFSFAEN